MCSTRTFVPLALVFLAACGSPPPVKSSPAGTPATPAPPPGGVTAAAAQPEPQNSQSLNLLAPGGEPRRALRFKPKVGATRNAVMVIEGRQEGVPWAAPIKHTLKTVMREVKPDGAAHYAFEIVKCEVVMPSRAVEDPRHAGFLKGMQQEAAAYVGVRGLALVSPRGLVEIQDPGDLAPEQRKALSQMQGQLSMMIAVPFAEEPVGVGGRWEVVTVVGGGMVTRGRTVYEVLSMRGDVITLGLTITQTADPNPRAVMLQSGETFQPLTFNARGSGRLQVDLGKLVPDLSELTFEMRSTARVTKGSVTRDQPVNIKISVRLEGQ